MADATTAGRRRTPAPLGPLGDREEQADQGPAPSPAAPTASNRRPLATAGTLGTRNQISTAITAARAAEPRKSTREFTYRATAAESGRPSPPPLPVEALTRAIEELSRSLGATSRSRAMPSGTMPIPTPCSPRPTIIGTTEEASAQTTEPAISGTEQAGSIRRLPSRSPRRPTTGTQTAETRGGAWRCRDPEGGTAVKFRMTEAGVDALREEREGGRGLPRP